MVEGLLVAERDKPSLSQDAYDRLRDTLAHLTFHYGREKGSEALRETWVKVKTTDEPADVSEVLCTGTHIHTHLLNVA